MIVMLNGITWKQFLEGTALLSLAYYVAIGLLYYRQDITSILRHKPSPVKNEAESVDVYESLDPLMPQIYELMTGIRELLQRAAAQQYVNNETIFGLQQLLKEYPAVKASRFVPSINNEIIQLSNELLGRPLNADELQAVWN